MGKVCKATICRNGSEQTTITRIGTLDKEDIPQAGAPNGASCNHVCLEAGEEPTKSREDHNPCYECKILTTKALAVCDLVTTSKGFTLLGRADSVAGSSDHVQSLYCHQLSFLAKSLIKVNCCKITLVCLHSEFAGCPVACQITNSLHSHLKCWPVW